MTRALAHVHSRIVHHSRKRFCGSKTIVWCQCNRCGISTTGPITITNAARVYHSTSTWSTSTIYFTIKFPAVRIRGTTSNFRRDAVVVLSSIPSFVKNTAWVVWVANSTVSFLNIRETDTIWIWMTRALAHVHSRIVHHSRKRFCGSKTIVWCQCNRCGISTTGPITITNAARVYHSTSTWSTSTIYWSTTVPIGVADCKNWATTRSPSAFCCVTRNSPIRVPCVPSSHLSESKFVANGNPVIISARNVDLIWRSPMTLLTARVVLVRARSSRAIESWVKSIRRSS